MLCAAGAVLVSLSRSHARAATAEPGATRSYDLPAGAAEQSLKLFSQQSGRGIVIGADTEKGVRTNAVKGDLTAQEALHKMLAGTGLIATRDEKSGAFAVQRENAGPNGPRTALTAASDRPNQSPAAESAPARNNRASSGTIIGRVFNPTTGEYVRNAEVRLQGSDRLVITESDGSFRIDNVVPGEATIAVSYTGYATATASLNVTAGQTATREINITPAGEAVQMGQFVVSSEREGNAKAIMAQRRNMNITNTVASDIFGDIAEGNIGEFIKYLPGVDVEYQDAETRGPRLGGLSPEYTGVSLDGARIASADALGSYNGFINAPDAGRSMGFEQLSISSIESIEVSRTLSADMDADSPAGNINLKSRRGFDRKGRRIDWQFSLTANSDDFKWGKTARPGDNDTHVIRPSFKLDYSDVFLNNRVGASLSYSQSKVVYQQQSVTHTYSRVATPTDPRPLVLTGINFGDGPKFGDRDTVSLNLDWKASPRLVLALTTMYNTYAGITFSRSLAFTAATANANVNTGRTNVLGDGITEIRTNGLATNTSRLVNITGGQNFDKKTKTFTVIPKFEYTLSRLLVDGGLTFSKSHNAYQALPDTIRTHTVNDLGVDFRATRSDANSAQWTIVQTGGPDWANLGNYLNPRISTNEDRGEIVKVYEATINARYTLPFEKPTSLKFGAKVNEQYRYSWSRNPANTHSFVGPGGNTVAANGTVGTNGSFANFVSPRLNATKMGPEMALNVVNMPRHANRQALGRAVQDHPEWLVDIATPANYYDGYYNSIRDFMQRVPAVYGMANTRWGKWQFQGGLRWEETETVSKQWDPRTPAEVIAAGFAIGANRRATTKAGIDYQFGSQPRIKVIGKYDNFFPSVSAKYSIRPNLDAQFGYSHSISRPPISALAGVWTIDDVNLIVNAPNTNLRPEVSDNFVARLAYYFEPAGSLTLLVQQMEITDLRITRSFTFEEFGLSDDPAYQNYNFISTTNSDVKNSYRNFEIGYTQQMTFLPGLLRGTRLDLAYSRSYSNIRSQGQLPHKFSGGVAWNYWRVNFRLNGIWHDDAPWTSTSIRFQRHNVKFDLSAGFKLTPRMSLFVQGRNILNEPTARYEPHPDPNLPPVLQSMLNYGTNWAFGIKGNF
jgi:iron complex outermembrane recepter protein